MPGDADKYWSSLYQELSRALSAEGVPESAFKSWHDAVEAFQSEFQSTVQEAGAHGPETANYYRAFGFSLLAAHEPRRAARMLFQAWMLRPRPLDLTSPEQYHEFKALRGLLVQFGFLLDAIAIQEEVASQYGRSAGGSSLHGEIASLELGLVYLTLGATYNRAQQFEAAVQTLPKAIRILKRHDSHSKQLAAAHNNLGLAYLQQRKYRKSLGAFKEAGSLASACDPHLSLIAVDNQCQALIFMKRFKQAEPLLETALRSARGTPTLPTEDLQIMLEDLVHIKMALSKFTEAQVLLTELSKPPFDPYSESSLANLGSLLDVCLQTKDHLTAHNARVALEARTSDPKVPIWGAHSFRVRLATKWKEGKEGSAKLPLFFDIIARRQKSSVDVMTHNRDRGLAKFLMAPDLLDVFPLPELQARYEAEITTQYASRFGPLADENADPLEDLMPAVDDRKLRDAEPFPIVRHYAAQGNYELAGGILAMIGLGGKLFLGENSPRARKFEITYLAELARTLYSKGKFKECVDRCKDFEAAAGDDTTPDRWLDILILAADALEHLGDDRGYFACLLEALKCSQASTSDVWMMHALELRVSLLARPEEFAELLVEKIGTAWNLLGMPMGSGKPTGVPLERNPRTPGFGHFVRVAWEGVVSLTESLPVGIDLLNMGALAFEANRDPIRAAELWLELTERFLEIGDRVAFLGTITRARRLLGKNSPEWWFNIYRLEGLAFQLFAGDTPEAIKRFKGAVEITESTRSRLGDAELQASYLSRSLEVSRSLVALLIEMDDLTGAWCFSERSSARTLLDRFVAKDLAPGLLASGEHLEALKEAMRPDDAILVPLVLADELATLVLRKDGISVVRAPVERRDLATMLRDYLAAVHSEDRSLYLPAAQRLHSTLLEPVTSALNDVTRIIWIPDHDLAAVPIDCLHDGRSYCFERFRFVQCFSSMVYLKLCQSGMQAAGRRVLVVGNSLGDLHFSQEESEWVERQFKDRGATTTSLIGPNAVLSSVVSSLREADLGHFACHGFFNPIRIEESYIALAPNAQGERQHLNLNSIRGSEIAAKLVVLASCRLGESKLSLGNEASGFVRELISAGVTSVLAPLWEVDDEATLLFCRSFYSALFEGRAVDEAVQSAKLALLAGSQFTDPKHLAAIQLFGSGNAQVQ